MATEAEITGTAESNGKFIVRDVSKPDYSNLKISLINFRARQKALVLKFRAITAAEAKRVRRCERNNRIIRHGGWLTTAKAAQPICPEAAGLEG